MIKTRKQICGLTEINREVLLSVFIEELPGIYPTTTLDTYMIWIAKS
jgi:hypothetical protein